MNAKIAGAAFGIMQHKKEMENRKQQQLQQFDTEFSEEEPDFSDGLLEEIEIQDAPKHKMQEYTQFEHFRTNLLLRKNSTLKYINAEKKRKLQAAKLKRLNKVLVENYSNIQKDIEEECINLEENRDEELAIDKRMDVKKSRLSEIEKRDKYDKYDPQDHKSTFLKELEQTATPKLRHKIQYANIKCIIFPDDSFKTIWDLLILLVLLYTFIITPYRLAFVEEDDLYWIMISAFVDFLFFVDIICNFFIAFYNKDDNLITEKKRIAWNYLKGWFFIDTLSILPIQYMVSLDANYTQLARLSRLPRLYKLLKMGKLVRLMNQNSLVKISRGLGGLERIIFILFVFICLCHVIACLWFLVAKLEDTPYTWVLRYGYQDSSNYDIYISALYWAAHAITVGFTDLNLTSNEKLFAIVVMGIGVGAISFVVGSLTSVLTTLDAKQATLKEKLLVLDKIKRENKGLNDDLYIRIRQCLKYEYATNDEKITFLNELPPKLQEKFSLILHKEKVASLPFFKDKKKGFIANVAPLLHSIQLKKGEYVFEENDSADKLFFFVKGSIGLVLKDKKDELNDILYLKFKEGDYFGELDMLLPNEEGLFLRHYTAKVLEDSELFVLREKDLFAAVSGENAKLNELFKNSEKKIKRILEIKHQAREAQKKSEAFQYQQNLTMAGSSLSVSKNFQCQSTLETALTKLKSTVNMLGRDILHLDEIKSYTPELFLKPAYLPQSTLPQVPEELRLQDLLSTETKQNRVFRDTNSMPTKTNKIIYKGSLFSQNVEPVHEEEEDENEIDDPKRKSIRDSKIKTNSVSPKHDEQQYPNSQREVAENSELLDLSKCGDENKEDRQSVFLSNYHSQQTPFTLENMQYSLQLDHPTSVILTDKETNSSKHSSSHLNKFSK